MKLGVYTALPPHQSKSRVSIRHGSEAANDVRWGLMATGRIAAVMAEAARPGRFVAVASRAEDRARRSPTSTASRAATVLIRHCWMIRIDAVYIALPVAQHSEWTIRALQAGKHVLCEKPLAVDAATWRPTSTPLTAVAGRAAGILQTRLARKLVADGAIGTLRSVRAALTVPIPAEDIRRSRELGGGALGDLGCYCVSAIRLFAGQPVQVYAVGLNDAADVEMRVSATVVIPMGLSQFDIGFDLTRRDQLELIGTDGYITVIEPWICGAGASRWSPRGSDASYRSIRRAPSR